MPLVWLLFLLCSSASLAYSQGFNVRFTHDGVFGHGLSVEVKGDSLYCLAYTADTTEVNGINTLLARVDLEGNLQQYTEAAPMGYQHFLPTQNCLIKTRDGGFACSGYTFTDQPDTDMKVLFVKFDSLMNVEFYREFADPTAIYYVGRRVVQTADGGYVIAGPLHIGSNTDIFLLKADSQGVYQWRMVFENGEQTEGVSGLYIDSLQQIWIGGGGTMARLCPRIMNLIRFSL